MLLFPPVPKSTIVVDEKGKKRERKKRHRDDREVPFDLILEYRDI